MSPTLSPILTDPQTTKVFPSITNFDIPFQGRLYLSACHISMK